LQHPLGVAFHDGVIYVADTYNHKIKKLNPATKELSTFIGTGKRGMADGAFDKTQLNEPAGLCFADGKMFIADANNHVIRVCDLKTGRVSTMEWKGLEKLAGVKSATPAAQKETTLVAQKISPEVQTLEFKVVLPRGKKLNPAAESKIKVTSSNAEIILVKEPDYILTKEALAISVALQPGKSDLRLQLTIFYCDEGNAGLCYFQHLVLKIPVEVKEGEATKLAINYEVAR